MKYKRIFVIVIDSVGVGGADDAEKYGDQFTNTLKNVSYSKIDFSIPTTQSMGIGNITSVYNTPPCKKPIASFGQMKEISVGKDTLTGHWELMGLKVMTPFPSFTDTGFPDELIQALEEASQRKIIGNVSASGTEIIKEYGEHQMKTGDLIVYTSADSVLQIAAHEDIIPLEELYRICEVARKLTLDNKQWMVGRIIARPYVGSNRDQFIRTSNRHDYAVKPFEKTVLDSLKEKGLAVISVGKIKDIFEGQGITEAHKIKSNQDGMETVIRIAQTDFTGLCFANLVDFDALFGHRRDALGYAKSLEEFDHQLAQLLPLIQKDDLLMICADHGNDPLHTGTDHTRENVPILIYGPKHKSRNLKTRQTFADVGASVAHNFKVTMPKIGKSMI